MGENWGIQDGKGSYWRKIGFYGERREKVFMGHKLRYRGIGGYREVWGKRVVREVPIRYCGGKVRH